MVLETRFIRFVIELSRFERMGLALRLCTGFAKPLFNLSVSELFMMRFSALLELHTANFLCN